MGTVDCTRQDELRMQCAQPVLEPAEPIAGTRAQRAVSDALRPDGIESYPTLLLFAEGSPGGIKAALEVQGKCKNVLRLPLWPVSSEHYNKIASEVKKLA